MPQLLADWHEGRAAVRMLVAALAAYRLTTAIHLPGPYSAVITTLILARPHSGGALRASAERLLATLVGAAIASIATLGRLAHLSELMLIGIALAPLALIAAHNSAYRTSMIAAVIVLSAPASGSAPLYVAGVRMLGVSLGALIGSLVSITILPSRREIVVASAIAKILEQYAGLLRIAIGTHPADARARDKLELRARGALRDLGALVRDRPDAAVTQGPAAAMVRFSVQMHADIVFLKRELRADEPAAPSVAAALQQFSRTFEETAAGIASLARGRGQGPATDRLRHDCGRAALALREGRPESEGARLMFRRLVEDTIALTRVLEGAPGNPGP